MNVPVKGQWAEIRQGAGEGEWLPFLITHVIDAETVSGVAFTGHPFRVGWSHPVGDFNSVKRGDINRCWRPLGGESDSSDDQVDDLTAINGVGKKTAEWLSGNSITTFADLAGLSDDDVQSLLESDGLPRGVGAEEIGAWRSDAAGRTG